MRLFSHLSFYALALGSSLVSAQVYESYDSSGNPVFSGQPSTNSVRVDIEHTNLADSVQPTEQVDRASDTPAKTSTSAGSNTWQDDRRIVVHDKDEDRHEVGDENLGRHEVGDENLHRHEVGDHLVEHGHEQGVEPHDHSVSGLGDGGAIRQRHIVVHHRGHR